ncbi:MAG TPA: winged helix-turn-helix transcriptional regulator [Kofleriaceae bacterium]|jgi:hypothetical protein|nr:winged helix-turn-helix transcriptional regulator [Kofleriaceae bacterium]
MTDLQHDVNRTVEGFVAQVIELVRHAAVETLQVAFHDPTAIPPARTDPEPAAAIPGRRRTSEHVDALGRRIVAVVRAQPGLRIAELGARLGTTPRALARPLRKLVAEGMLEPRGKRRATTYVARAVPDPAPEPPDAPATASFDAEWYRCLAGVFMLAHKLQK